jgi:preprotein translocase subunit SecE
MRVPFAAQGAYMKKIVQFFKDSYAELRKVVWPTREDVLASTKVVIVSTLVMALVLGLFDGLFGTGIDKIFR